MSSKFNHTASSSFKSDDYLEKALNLNDVDNKTKCIENLGILTQPVFITDSLLKTNNLIELTNRSTARVNLGFQPSVLTDLVTLKSNNGTNISNIAENKTLIDQQTLTIAENTATLNTHTATLNTHTNQINGHDTKFSDNDALWGIAITHFDTILPQIPNIQLHTDQIANIVSINNQQQFDIKDALDDIKILQQSDIGDLSTLQAIVDDHSADIKVINGVLVDYENRIDIIELKNDPDGYDDTKLITDIKINTDAVAAINTSIGTIDGKISTINTKNDDQDSKISTLQDENKTQTTSISNNTNGITTNTNDITALENLQSSYYMLNGSRQMIGDIIFNGGTRFIRSIDKNMIGLNYSDGSISIPSLNNGLVRSIAGKLINSQLSANDIDPSSIADSKLQTSYLPIDGSKQITGNLSFNSTIKSINNFSELNLISTGLTPSNVKVNGTGLTLSSSNLTLSNWDGVSGYTIPTARGGLNQILKLDINNNMQWTNLPDISNKIDKGGNIGMISIGSTSADTVSLIQNNTPFLIKNNSNLIIDAPTIFNQKITIVNYSFPTNVGTNGQILQLNGNNLEFKNLPTVDISNKLDKGGNIGSIIIGSTDSNLSLIQNNSVFLQKTNTALNISAPEILLNDYVMPVGVGSLGQIMRIGNNNRIEFQDMPTTNGVPDREYYRLLNPNDYTMNINTQPQTIPIFTTGAQPYSYDIHSSLLVNNNGKIQNISNNTRYFKITCSLICSLQDLNYILTLVVDGINIWTVNPSNLTGIDLSIDRVEVKTNSLISFEFARVNVSGLVNITLTSVTISELETLPYLRVGYDYENSYSLPQYASATNNDTILKYNASTKAYENDIFSYMNYSQVHTVPLVISTTNGEQTPSPTWQFLITSGVPNQFNTHTENMKMEYKSVSIIFINKPNAPWPHIRINKYGWYRFNYTIQWRCSVNNTYFLSSVGRLLGNQVPTKITESLGGASMTLQNGNVETISSSCVLLCNIGDLMGILYYYRRIGATTTPITSDQHELVSYSMECEFLR